MKRYLSVPLLAALFAAAFSVAPASAANPIQIQQCFITVPKALSKTASGTQIVYVNRGPKTAAEVDFVVGYRNAAQHFVRRVSDYGAFAPNSVIDHHFGLYNDVTYAGKQTQSCYAYRVKWNNGNVWVSP